MAAISSATPGARLSATKRAQEGTHRDRASGPDKLARTHILPPALSPNRSRTSHVMRAESSCSRCGGDHRGSRTVASPAACDERRTRHPIDNPASSSARSWRKVCAATATSPLSVFLHAKSLRLSGRVAQRQADHFPPIRLGSAQVASPLAVRLLGPVATSTAALLADRVA
jgi:hypothetical protein